MELITIRLPEHAVRFLRKLLKEKRHEMARQKGGYTLQMDAAFDSLNALEEALPDE